MVLMWGLRPNTRRTYDTTRRSYIPALYHLVTTLLLLLLYLIRRVQPCGYDALIYMLRTLGPVSFLHLSVFSTCILVRFSSLSLGLSAPLPECSCLIYLLKRKRKGSWNGGGEWLKGIKWNIWVCV